MALNDRNIVIVPNKGNSSVPVITFSGADETVSEQTINVKVYAANSGTLSFESWTAGQLFSISNDREPVVYGVNDISGIPLFQVFESGQVNLSQYFGNVQIGTTSPDGTSLLQVQGITKTNSLRITAYGEVIAANGRWMGPSSGLEGAQGIQGVQGVQGTSIQGIQGIQGSSGGGGGSPGGTTNQIQYNSGGALAGSANLTFTTSTGNVFAVGTSAFTANSTSGNVGIGVINPAAKLETRGYVICGDVESTSGAKLIRGYYSSGAITTLGSSRSSGGPVVGYAVEPNTTIEVSASGLISSTPAYLARSAYYLTGNTHYWFTGPHQTVLTGDPVTMYQKMVLANSGVTIYPGIIGPTYGLTVSGGDITAARSASVGAIYFGTDGTHYLYYNGSNYLMPAGGLLMGGDAVIGNNTDNVLRVRRLNGKSATTNDADHLYINYDAAGKNVYIGPGANVVWHAGNDGSGSGLDADLLDGVHGASFVRNNATNNILFDPAYKTRYYSNTVLESTSQNQSSLEVYQPTLGEDAFMTFHILNDFAGYFGLAGDINDFCVGGFSYGANKYRIWHAGNDGVNSGLDADLLDGNQASAFALLTGATFTGNVNSPDSRVARYTSLSGSPTSGSWFKIFNVADGPSGEHSVMCTVRTHAHSSVTFIAARGYIDSHVSSINVLQATLNRNASHANITGIRILESGDVEIRLVWTSGPTVIVNVRIIGSDYTPTPSETLTATAGSPTVEDTVLFDTDGVHGIMRSKGSMIASKFASDSNQNYYANPASTSVLNALTVGGGAVLGSANAFNNMNQNHATQTDFNSITDFGARYVQGGTNGPGTGGGSAQYYGFTLGLGSDYPYSQYASQLYWPRTVLGGNPYLSVRFREATTWGAWTKIYAGYADTAGAVDFNNLTNKTSGTGTYTTSGDFRAPIFYDSNDTNYYVNPAGTSVANNITVVGWNSFLDTAHRDSSNAEYYPNSFTRGTKWHFSTSTSVGTGGNYAGVLNFHPWDGTTASTGDASYQLVFGSTATNGSGFPWLRIRKGIDTTWNSFYGLALYGVNAGDATSQPLYATQFIDSNNTAYYLDPASTSVLSTVNSTNTKTTGTIIDTPIQTVTASSTFADNAAGKILVVDSASPITVTFAAATTSGFSTTIIRKNTGDVTIAVAAGVTKLNSANFTTSTLYARYSAATVIYSATNEIILIGDIL